MLNEKLINLVNKSLLYSSNFPNIPKHIFNSKLINVKASVFPFKRFVTEKGTTVDMELGPEMRSTGEVMGRSNTFPKSFAKAYLSSVGGLPKKGNVFVSVADHDKRNISLPCKKMVDMGFKLYTTAGTASVLEKNGIKSIEIGKLFKKQKSVLTLISSGKMSLIINVPQAQYEAQDDSYKIRATAIANNIPVLTTTQQFISAVQAIEISQSIDVIKPEKL